MTDTIKEVLAQAGDASPITPSENHLDPLTPDADAFHGLKECLPRLMEGISSEVDDDILAPRVIDGHRNKH